jgi:hypothetical protein
MDLCSARNNAADDCAAARQPHPGPDIAEAEPAATLHDGFGVEPLPIIPDGYLYTMIVVIQKDGDAGRLGMPDTILEAFLDGAEQDQLFPGLDFPDISRHYHLGPDKAGLVDPVDFLCQRMLQTVGLDPVAAETARQVPEISHGLPDIVTDILQHPFVEVIAGIHHVDLNLGEAEDLPYIVMDLLADGEEGLFLDLQLRLQRLLPKLQFQLRHLFLLREFSSLVQEQEQQNDSGQHEQQGDAGDQDDEYFLVLIIWHKYP